MNNWHYVILNTAFLLLIAGCTSQEKTKTPSAVPSADLPQDNPSESLVEGKNLYRMFCLMCHGEDGTMKQTGNYDLAKSTLDLDAIIAVTAQGRGTMMPYKSILSEEKLKAVSEYTLQLQTK